MKAIRAVGFTLFKWTLGGAIGLFLLYAAAGWYDFCSGQICSGGMYH